MTMHDETIRKISIHKHRNRAWLIVRNIVSEKILAFDPQAPQFNEDIL